MIIGQTKEKGGIAMFGEAYGEEVHLPLIVLLYFPYVQSWFFTPFVIIPSILLFPSLSSNSIQVIPFVFSNPLQIPCISPSPIAPQFSFKLTLILPKSPLIPPDEGDFSPLSSLRSPMWFICRKLESAKGIGKLRRSVVADAAAHIYFFKEIPFQGWRLQALKVGRS